MFVLRSLSLKPLSLQTYWSVSKFPTVRNMSALSARFEEAKKRSTTLSEEPGNDVKLKMYGLFKQATVGQCNTTKPGAFDFVGKAKWEAWNGLGKMTNDEAMKNYIALVDDLAKDSSPASTQAAPGDNKYEGLVYKVDDKVTRITFNRPAKKNAITTQMYRDLINALKEAAANDTSFTVITGTGDYYSSGNDLGNFTGATGDLSKAAHSGADLLKEFVASFIDFPKPLIAAVNGPAVGIPVTLLGLFDAVYASDKATFITPFSLLGQSPEACATYTFPKIMGYAKANEMLMFNRKLTADEAKSCGLVADVFPDLKFQEEVEKRITAISSASKNSMFYSKQLIRDIERDALHKVNVAECARLAERWQSPDCMEAIMKFFQSKSRL